MARSLFATFYSFKGGVGRSLTLVNTAVELTNRGHQVIIWDLDIEAPGIQHIPYFNGLQGTIKTGFVDIAANFVEKNCKKIDDRLFSSSVYTHPDNPNLRLLPAGDIDNEKEYARKFAAIQWDKLFGPGKTAGFRLFEDIKTELLSFGPHFVLIDSRTGFTDTGGVCCFKLPDVVFLVFNYGNQNLKGMQGIHSALTQREWTLRLREGRELKTFLAASMVPLERPDLRKQRKARWMENRDPDFTIHAEIPYNTEMAFNETVWPAEYPDHEFCRHYAKIADILAAERANLFRGEEETVTEAGRPVRRGRFGGADPRGEGGMPYLDPAVQFEQDTAHLFRLMGFEAEVDKLIQGSQVDVFLTKKSALKPVRYIVECKHWDKNVDKAVVDEVENNLKSARTEFPACRGILVAKKGFTKEAKAYAESVDIEVKTYDELLNGIIDFEGYVSYIKTLYAGTELEKNYIPQDVMVENTEYARPLLGYADEWLAGTQGGFFTLLGDFGTGKTSFTKRLSHDLAVRYEKEKSAGGARVPVLINLKEVSKALSLENIIFEHFTRTVKMNVAPEAFLHLLKAGKIVLIFDGFDEMATQSNMALTMKNFMELNRAFAGETKVLLTCRTHYFKDRVETEETVKAKAKGLSEFSTELYRAIQGKQGYTLGYLQEFRKEQIDAYLQKALPGTWQEAQGLIDGVYNLKDLASRPVLLDMIVKSLPAIRAREGDIGAADLYSAYVQVWVDRDDWRHELTREGRKFLVEEMALRMWEEETDRLHYSRINDLLTDFLKDKRTVVSVNDVEFASSEVRTASFLTRDDEGNYGFAHRSFMEYFLARGIMKKLKEKDTGCLDIKRLSKEVILFLVQLAGTETMITLCGEVLAEAYRRRVSENCLLCLYWGVRYSVSADGTMKDPAAFRALFSQKRPATLMLRGADLEGAELPWAGLSGADLEGAKMSGAVLTGASLASARLKGADISFGLLDGVDLSEADVSGAAAHHVSFKKAIMKNAAFSGTDLHACTFMDADMTGANFDNADLSYSGFLRAKLDMEKGLGTAVLDFTGISGTPLTDLRPAVQLGHSWFVNSAAFSPDGRMIVSAGYDNTVKLRDAESGHLLRTLTGHTNNITSAAFSPDGRFIASAGWDRTVRLWESKSGRLLRTLTGHIDSVTSAAFSPDGNRIVSASRDQTVRLWESESGRLLRTLMGHEDGVNSVAFSMDGEHIVSASRDETVRLWESESGRLLRTLTGHKSAVYSAAFSPNGHRIVSAGRDNTVLMWECESGCLLRRLKGHEGTVYSVTFSPDGSRIVSGSRDETVRLWESESGRLLRMLTGHEGTVYSVAFSPDGGRIVSAGDDQRVRLWESESGRLLRMLPGHGNIVGCATFSLDGQHIISANPAQRVWLWESASGRLLRTLTGHEGVVSSTAFSPDGRCIVSTGDDKSVRLWETESGRLLRTLTGHEREATSAAFSPNGRLIVSAGNDRTVRLWESESGRLLRTLTGHERNVTSAAFSPDGRRIVSASWDQTVRLWESKSGRLLHTLAGHEYEVNSTAFSPDGWCIVSASRDNTIRLWETESGRLLRTLTGHSDVVTSAAFSPDGRWVVSVSRDGSIRLWATETGKEVAALKNLTFARNAAFAPDGARLCIATDEGILMVGVRYSDNNISGLDILRTMYSFPVNDWLALSPDNRFACSDGGRDYLFFTDNLALYPAADLPELERRGLNEEG